MNRNGHRNSSKSIDFTNGIQVVNSDGEFGESMAPYLAFEKIIPAGFNYHIISVFGSQSTGKSTLLNNLFGTNFGVMNEEERRQTTKGIWLSKNKKEGEATAAGMAENILVMDVEGTDGQERGENQDFERKSALFALATSEVLLVNMWETQVGLYHGANMGLLKTVFEVNLQLFVKDNQAIPRSLLLFVIRDHTGRTPLTNLRNTLINNLTRIWSSISKPEGLEDSRIEDYFDFAFAALPHKLLQPDLFELETAKLGQRFKMGYKDPKKIGLVDEASQPFLVPEYHRRIPADGFPVYAKGVWEQIMSNKDLDLPTQQELLAQFRCLEISRECMVAFDDIVVPIEKDQADAVKDGQPVVTKNLGEKLTAARTTLFRSFEGEASRYHKGVYERQKEELETTVDSRLKILFDGQLSAAHKLGLISFNNAVSKAVQDGSKSGSQYDFAEIVELEKKKAISQFEDVAHGSSVAGTEWSDFTSQLRLFNRELDKESKQLRQNEMRLLATRIERWIKSHLDEAVGLEFSKLSSGRATTATENEHWDRVWTIFTDTVTEGEKRFTDRAKSFDASPEEVEVGLWRLRRKAWSILKVKINEEVTEGNLGLKLRENFEDRFRYDDAGVPRIWRPTDDIDGAFGRARDHTLTLIPLLSKFRLSSTSASPPLDAWLGSRPTTLTRADEEDLTPIGGVDDNADATLDDEMLLLSENRQSEVTARFRKAADAVYVEAKRGALGGMRETPMWMWALLLVLGQNEIIAVARSPMLLILGILAVGGLYVTYQLNLWDPILRVSGAAWTQGLQVGKERLREFLLSSEVGRQAVAMEGRQTTNQTTPESSNDVKLENLDGKGKKVSPAAVWSDDEE